MWLFINIINSFVYFFQVNGFPTIFLYRDGEKITEYNGSRSLEDLYQFVMKHANDVKDKDEL